MCYHICGQGPDVLISKLLDMPSGAGYAIRCAIIYGIRCRDMLLDMLLDMRSGAGYAIRHAIRYAIRCRIC